MQRLSEIISEYSDLLESLWGSVSIPPAVDQSAIISGFVKRLEAAMKQEDPSRFYDLLEAGAHYTRNPLMFDVLQEAFLWAVRGEHFHLIKKLAHINAVSLNAHANNNRVLYGAMFTDNYSRIGLYLLNLPTVFAKAHVENNRVLVLAASRKSREIVNRLLDNPQVLANAHVKDNIVLIDMVDTGDLDIVNRLLTSSDVRENADIKDNKALYTAATHGHLEIVNRLLEIPAVLEEAAVRENYILHSAVEHGHVDVVRRLLEIPHVREEAHVDGNYILRDVQMRLNDQDLFPEEIEAYQAIVDTLLEVEAVRRYHREHEDDAPELAQLARHDENSMRALDKQQEGMISVLKKHYQAQFEAKTKESILLDFQAFLEKNYQADPAKDKEGNALPLAYREDLSDEELQPYFKHHAHTVWRWLFCHPNPWIHPAAEYLDPEAVHSAHITDAHKETIAYLWLAACDTAVQLEAEWTVEKMQAYFIRSIAYLGRAHNWYERNERGEEIRERPDDDLQRDRPSCVSGVMQRLVDGAIIGHPYFMNSSARELNETAFSEKCWQGFFNPLYTQYWEKQGKETLKLTKSALDKIALDLDSVTDKDKETFYRPVCEVDRENFMRECKVWWDEKRLREPCVWQGKPFDNYHALFAHWCDAPEPAISFWSRLDAVLKGYLEKLREMTNFPSTSTGIYHIRKRRLPSKEDLSDENNENNDLKSQQAKRKR